MNICKYFNVDLILILIWRDKPHDVSKAVWVEFLRDQWFQWSVEHYCILHMNYFLCGFFYLYVHYTQHNGEASLQHVQAARIVRHVSRPDVGLTTTLPK